MNERIEKLNRRCPGELYDISESICRGRQRVHYPKCPLCHYRIEVGTNPSKSKVKAEKNPETIDVKSKPIESSSAPKQSINKKIFKSYDIRGIYPDELNEYASEKIGIGTGIFLKGLRDVKNIVVARDGRPSSESLANSLIKGILKTGVNVIDIGMASTDTTYFAVGFYNYDAGITVTASHNPSKYNGFKLCHEKAMPISFDTGLSKIYEIAMQTNFTTHKQPGRVIKKHILNDYKKHVLSFANKNIRPLKVVVDAGNGMAGPMIPVIFEDLPCKILPLYFKLDGTFPNHEPDPLKEENLRDLQKKVRRTKSNLGVAFDGDADRCVFVDENGQTIGCDLITAIIAKELLQKKKGSTIVYDLRSSWIVPEEIKNAGGNPYRERVGHSHIKAAMREKNAIFGGELSGHYYFRDNYYAGSGIIALIEVLNILSSKNVPMSNLISPLKGYHATGETNFEVEDKDGKIKQIAEHFKNKKGKIDYLDGITVQYKDWWFNVRKSNTEPLLRLNLEGKTKEIMERRKKQIIEIIKEG